MAAKRVLRYRGHVIRVWEKSYSIDNGPVVFVGEAPDKETIKRDIDEGLANVPNAALKSDHAADATRYSYYASLQFGIRDPTWFERLRDNLKRNALGYSIAFVLGHWVTLATLIALAHWFPR